MGLTAYFAKPVPQTGPFPDTVLGIRAETDMLEAILVDRADSSVTLTAREFRKAAESADRLAELLRRASRACVR